MFTKIIQAGTVAAFILFPAAAFAQCAPAVADKNLTEAGKLLLSINPTNPPQQFIDKDGNLQGLNVELAAEIGKRLCMPVELVRMDFPAMIPAMNAGRIDGLNTGMFWTEERSKLMYTVPYGRQSVSIVVAPDSDGEYTKPEDLLGKVSAVEVSSYQMNWLKKFSDEHAAATGEAVDMRTFPTATNVVSALLAGQVDNALLVDSVAREVVSKGRVKEALTDLGAARTTLAFSNRTVAEAVVKALNEMRDDGTYQALFDKFGLTALLPDQPLEIVGPGPV
ncbi:ABC transporter substrate-binding protein [Mesorhizobium sp. YR577]|uniref:ABC transporter substrate-binding protein n=1 Tax=Mesorhizobium sp. YR577 TaxID=1884373 RepID=UPI0008DF0AC3|nr:ABC transporter substrate-binding protein [Mesorhizobium sp. YR577]SFT55785.1 amino acid ABC transporter substrate-binding protein, PAAT family [Mesorhizobium sp. YR577]